VDANASNNSVIDTDLSRFNFRRLQEIGSPFGGEEREHDYTREYVKENSRYISTTDPDAGDCKSGEAEAFYQVHRAVGR